MKLSASMPAPARLLQLATLGASMLALPARALDTAAGAVGHAAAASTSAAVSSPPSPTVSSLTMLSGLILVLGLIAGIAWFLKRAGLAPGLQSSAAAKIVGGVSVGNRERVVVVEVADLWIVVGVAPGRVNALATMPRQETAAGAAPAANNFSSWMKQIIEKRNGPR
jgi:flagellar protein FliO/FliZ